MKFVDEYYEGIYTGLDAESTGEFIWTYDLNNDNENDFYLKPQGIWQTLTTDAYIVRIGDECIKIPFSYFILIADYNSGLDCIKPDEILGREFSALTISSEMDENTTQLELMTVIGYENRVTFTVPLMKGLFPVLLRYDRVILVSQNDFYNKVKNITIGSLI